MYENWSLGSVILKLTTIGNKLSGNLIEQCPIHSAFIDIDMHTHLNNGYCMNNDSTNETWHIYGLSYEENIYIFWLIYNK